MKESHNIAQRREGKGVTAPGRLSDGEFETGMMTWDVRIGLIEGVPAV